MIQRLSLVILLFCSSPIYAREWRALWIKPDREASTWMQQGDYARAQRLFENPSWKATAFYRMQKYKEAAALFGTMNTATGFYNQGNALAQQGQLQEAIQAYDKALALDKAHADAEFNRKIVEALLKKNKQPEDKQSASKPSKPQEDKPQEDKQDKQAASKPQTQDKPTQAKPSKPDTKTREKQQAKAQWLQVIPDDPGGLLREKFLRDYLKRQTL
jgi:Ca-activated chloride channel family protein